MDSNGRTSKPLKQKLIARKGPFDLLGGPEPWTLMIALNHWTEVDEGKPCLTPDCVSEGELNIWIDMLQRHLEALRAAGLRRFR